MKINIKKTVIAILALGTLTLLIFTIRKDSGDFWANIFSSSSSSNIAYQGREAEYGRGRRIITAPGQTTEKAHFMTSYGREIEKSECRPFYDVYSQHWACEIITYSKVENIVPPENLVATNNTDENWIFRPDDFLTRSEAIAFLVRATGIDIPENISEAPFADVGLSYWDTPYITVARNQHFIYYIPLNNTFRPQDRITRAEFLEFLFTTFNLQKISPDQITEKPFIDVGLGHWDTSYIATAARDNLMAGYMDGTFRPQGFITRAEALSVILRALQVDSEDIANAVYRDKLFD